jgi:hypothetical protein
MSTAASSDLSVWQFNLDGTVDEWVENVNSITGRYSSMTLLIGDNYGANPSTGDVYFQLHDSGSYDSDIGQLSCCPFLQGSFPDTFFENNIYCKLSPGSLSLLGEGTGTAHSDYWGTPPESALTGVGDDILFAGTYSYSGRNDPISVVSSDIESPEILYCLHWASQTGTAENTFLTSGLPFPTPYGSGQRNDNPPELFAKASKPDTFWRNTWYTDNGVEHLEQTTTITGTTTNFLPVTGMFGKWPVKHHIGRWAIFGPNTPPVEEGWARWYVV